MKGGVGSKFIFLRESKVNEHRNILVRNENICRSE